MSLPPGSLDALILEPRIAYFSMEIALEDAIPTFSGGLGVLAGDTMRSAADLRLPMVGVTLVSRAGYFRQRIVDGAQVEEQDRWEPTQHARRLAAKVAITIEQREVWVVAWLYLVQGAPGAAVPVLLLDTGLPENAPDDRCITDSLYGGDAAYRLKQEMVLGVGGVRMLAALGFTIRKFHLNEGHAALLALELLRLTAHTLAEAGTPAQTYDVPAVRKRCVFTTHTPVEAGHDQFPYDLADRMLGGLVEPSQLRALAGADRLNMTRLALNASEYVNGVARRHAEVSRRMFPGYEVHAITNGIHARTWAADSFRELFDRELPRWCDEPQLLSRADLLDDEQVWQAHSQAKRDLLRLVAAITGKSLAAELPIIGFARRMTAYKRPDLLFSDMQRLASIARRQPFQVILAGKAHPRDDSGKELIRRLHGWARDLQADLPVVFLPAYGMNLARTLVSGTDLWLNTPQRPLEASGTSGMKAAINGVPSLSVPDGWWLEGCIEGVTGWAIGADDPSDSARDAEHLYEKLERTILPLFREDRKGWIGVMKGAISRNASYFNTHRMMRRYAVEAYMH